MHVLRWWGKSFRPAFQLRQMHASTATRLARDQGKLIPLIGLMATLREGPPIDSIHKVLGLKWSSRYRCFCQSEAAGGHG